MWDLPTSPVQTALRLACTMHRQAANLAVFLGTPLHMQRFCFIFLSVA
nr:MAG TPA: hypothetical protein [Caudoviricetes sp.]